VIVLSDDRSIDNMYEQVPWATGSRKRDGSRSAVPFVPSIAMLFDRIRTKPTMVSLVQHLREWKELSDVFGRLQANNPAYPFDPFKSPPFWRSELPRRSPGVALRPQDLPTSTSHTSSRGEKRKRMESTSSGRSGKASKGSEGDDVGSYFSF